MREERQLVLFDGVCNFCNASVLFIVDRDPRARFVFAPLQSSLGMRTLREQGLSFESDPGLVLVDAERVYTHSTAALRIAKGMRFPWPLVFYLFILVPKFVRDAAYRAFARRRYAWFGKLEQCRVPDASLRARFVDAEAEAQPTSTRP